MNFSAFQRFQLIIILALIGTVTLPAWGNAYTEEQQRLCNDDAMRLCSEDVPGRADYGVHAETPSVAE